MKAIKRIAVRNMQAIKEFELHLPEVGLVGFFGDNSNGKSVITKTLQDLIQGNITRPECRKSLVNRNNPGHWGEFEIERYDGMKFLLHLHLEAAQTYYELTRPGGEPSRFYLSSKHLPFVLEEFGFHYDDKYGISLNICDSDDAVLFFNTPFKANGAVVETAFTDKTATTSLERLTAVRKNAKSIRDKAQHQKDIAEAARKGLRIWNVAEEEAKLASIKDIRESLKHIYIPDIPELPEIPDLEYLDIRYPMIPNLVYPEIYDLSVCIPDLIPIADEIAELEQGRCPTCGTRLIDREVHEHVT